MITKVVMPKLSDAMETGKVIKWLKKEGDVIKGGDVIAEVETDKANVELEAFGSGVLRKVVVGEGGQVPVGELIAVIAEPADDIGTVVAGASTAPAPTAAPVSAGSPSGSAPAPSSGDAAKPAAVPPAAAPGPVPATETYKSAPATEKVVPLTPESGGPRPQPAPSAAPGTMAPAATAPTGPRLVSTGAPTGAAAAGGRIKASPLAKKVAAQSGVDLARLQGSGPGGRIIRRDVEAAVAAGPAAPGAPAAAAAPPPAAAAPARAPFVIPARTEAEYEDVPLTPMRATIAKRMPMSKAPVPHFYVTSEVGMDRAWELRAELNALEGNPKVSVNDLVIRACALALLKHPGVNASLQGSAIRQYHRAHIGLAVALEGGLITPVLHDCDVKPLVQIAVEARDLAERARAGKLRVSELSGATFSISNLGMFDVEEFSAIINPPEGAILAVGSVLEKPVVVDGTLAVGRRMKLTISCDHRAMDGAMGARFLQDVKRLLEEPLRLLL
ncbi:MAG TPA: dihydrolipoamide acetyltransferase family protein [Pseudomonadales bacterium]|nr:dihydrolipoamide acetyltransferase family protein [Pseudomonadales bacterium]